MTWPPNKPSGNHIPEPHFDFVNQLAIRLLKRNTLSDLCWEIAEAIGTLPGFADCVLYLGSGGNWVQAAAHGPKRGPDREIVDPIVIPAGQGIVGHVALTGQPQLIPDTLLDARYIRDSFYGRSELTVPVIYQDAVIAVLDTEHKSVGAYTTAHLELLKTIANISASRIASAIIEEENRVVREELAKLNLELEQRVVQRTIELSNARDFILRERDRSLAVLNSMQNGLLVVNSYFHIELLSPSARRLTGWGQRDAVGHHLNEVFRLKEVGDLALQLAESSSLAVTKEAVLICRDNTLRDIRWHANVIQHSPQGSREFAIAFHDVTQEKYLARRTESFDRMKSLGILAGGIAHDFNNNLAAIQASIDCMTTISSPSEVRALDIARQACREAKQLTQQLLTFSKGGVPVRKPHSIEEILQTSASLATSGRRVTINWKLDSNLPFVMADSGQITQVFNNIFLNAAQAVGDTHDALITVQATVTPSTVAADDPGRDLGPADRTYIRVVVSDDGPGFDPATLNRVFEPYFSSSKGGSGLGLTSSFFIIQNHQGEIFAANGANGGAEVTVLIPTTSTLPTVPVDRTVTDSEDRFRILLLDDDELVRSSISMLLKSLGHEVVEASDGDAALEKISKENASGRKCQIALLDLTIQHGRGGAEIVGELKELCPGIVCVVVSGYSDRPAMASPQKFGFHAVLAKPFSRIDLKEVLRNVAIYFPSS